MPVVATSPPLLFGQTPSPTKTPIPSKTPRPSISPRPTRTPKPSVTPTPAVTPIPTVTPTLPGVFVSQHSAFVRKVDSLPSCFTQADFPDFTVEEFTEHVEVCIQDKYLIDNGTTFCSLQAVTNLSKALKRLGE